MRFKPPSELTAFRGQPCVQLCLPQGDTALVSLHGAQVLSWVTADGREQLCLSPAAQFDSHSPIRGGVPLCFPQFNQRVLAGRTLPKHGFARTLPWALAGKAPAPLTDDQGVTVTLQLSSSAVTQALWPHAFVADVTVSLCPGSLTINFAVRNTDTQPWSFAIALHTYLQVKDVAETVLHGLQGCTFWDAVTHLEQPTLRSQQAQAALTFSGETDRVYSDVDGPVTVQHAGGRVALRQSGSLPELVVWNPGPALCSSLRDMPPDGWRQMLCVEAACIDTPVTLAPGQGWSGWQQLSVLPAL